MGSLIRVNSISARFTFLAIIFILMVSLAAGIIGGSLAYNFTGERFHENFRLLSHSLAKNAELGLLLRDRDMLRNLAENLLELEDIFRVRILDETENTLVTARLREKEGLVSLKTPVMLSDAEEGSLFLDRQRKPRTLGFVVVEYSLKSLEQLQLKMIYFFVCFVLFFVVLSSVCFFLLSRSVAIPLKQILAVSKSVSGGEMDVRAEIGKLGPAFEEVETLAAGFNNMLDALQAQKMRAEAADKEITRQKALAEVGKFSMMVAHEVKNPLAIIKGSLDILKKKDLSDEMKAEMIRYVEEDIQRINKIMEEFLVFARPNRPDFADTEMNEYVDKLVERFSFTQENIIVKKFLDQTPARIRCDRAKMERALLNILGNAAEFAQSGIRVATAVKDGAWTLSISDDGPGIAEQRLEKIFEPFYTTRSRGTGLGLAIAKDVIQMHGAAIRADNLPDGSGALFEIKMECKA